MKPNELFDRALGHMNARAGTYDQPAGERNMAKIVAVFNAHHETALTEAQGWHFMQILKDVRLFSSEAFHQDSAEDGAAYLALKVEALAYERGEKSGLSLPQVDLMQEALPADEDEQPKKVVVNFAGGGGISGHASPHGFVLDYDRPAGCDVAVIGTQGVSIEPRKVLLPHQVYVRDLMQLLDTHGANELHIIPYRNVDLVTITRTDLQSLLDGIKFADRAGLVEAHK